MRALAGVALALVIAAASASDASACGYTVRSVARGDHARRAPLVLGDSTMIFAAPSLGRRGMQSDAKECRQFSEGVSILGARRRAGTLPRLSILALGANGPVSSQMLAGALHTIGPGHVLGLVIPRKSGVTEASMRRAARTHPDRVLLIDWVSFSAGHADWFAGDGLHVTPAAGRTYAAFIARASAPLYDPPVKALRLPSTARAAKACGTIHRSGAAVAVDVIRGQQRITCARARELSRRTPPEQTAGWTSYDWTATGRKPWREVYARADRRVIVATVRGQAHAFTAKAAATRRRTYSPIDSDGTLRDSLSISHSNGTADCQSGSYIVGHAYRCFNGNLIRDPCYLDTRSGDDDSILCVTSPWAKAATSLPISGTLPEESGAQSTPWALELASGSRCGFLSGATNAVSGYRLKPSTR